MSTLTIPEAAAAAGTSPEAIRLQIEQGRLRCVVGPDRRRRVPVEELERIGVPPRVLELEEHCRVLERRVARLEAELAAARTGASPTPPAVPSRHANGDPRARGLALARNGGRGARAA
jgi:hypothetical protein